MLMAGQQENLLARSGEFGQRPTGRPNTLLIEIHQNIIENERQLDSARRPITGQGQPQGEKELLSGPTR
ncbi:MAG: hypothetical protein H5U01_13870 [Clostridia bacterium]|nr:hypothetical protein [Clostridia bacterium]